MAIYKMLSGKEQLSMIYQTSFGQEGILERHDLQRILRDQPEVLEDGLLIISEEFSDWQNSNLKIDLLALDTEGRLVVIELKRGDTGEHMDLQAIRYASMVANMERQDVVKTFQLYLDKRGGQATDDAETIIREHLRVVDLDNEAIHTEVPRLILASEGFGKELTTCVMWLNDSWLRSVNREIKCISLRPHKNGDEVLIESRVVIPLPEAKDYQTRLGRRKRETQTEDTARPQILQGGDSFQESIARAQEKSQLGLNRLYECASDLDKRGIVELFTWKNAKDDYVQLQLRLPGTSSFLASFNNVLSQQGIGEISIWPGWTELSLEFQKSIDELIGPVTSTSGVRHRRLSIAKTSENLENILAVITEAYKESFRKK